MRQQELAGRSVIEGHSIASDDSLAFVLCCLGLVGWPWPDTAKLVRHRKHDHRPCQAITPDQPAAVIDPNQADLGSGVRRGRAEQARGLEVLGDLCGGDDRGVLEVCWAEDEASMRERDPVGMDRPGVVTASKRATVSGCGSAGSSPTAGSGWFDVWDMIGPSRLSNGQHADRQALTADTFQDRTIGAHGHDGRAPTGWDDELAGRC